MKHYYDILDANYSDSLQTIHKKYKKKARQWHPDMFKESNDKINNALMVIKRLALVKERFTFPKFISGPIL